LTLRAGRWLPSHARAIGSALPSGHTEAAARPAVARETVFAWLVLAAVLNAASKSLFEAVDRSGLVNAFLNTFGVSVIVWLGLGVAVAALARAPGRPLTRLDGVAAGVAALMIVCPIPWFSQLAVAGLGIYLWLTSRRGDPVRGAAAIVLALSITFLWARLLLALFTDVILRFDTVVVGFLVGETPVGNVVPFPDGSGFMYVLPACSSVTNMSLALIAVAVFANLYKVPWSRRLALWSALAGASVFAINVTRMALIALFPQHYDTLHGVEGATVTAWLTVAVVLAICVHGVGSDAARSR
jgi:exosortase/archaeosortase family protein